MWTLHISKLKMWMLCGTLWMNVVVLWLLCGILWMNGDVLWMLCGTLWRNMDVLWRNVDVMWTLHISTFHNLMKSSRFLGRSSWICDCGFNVDPSDFHNCIASYRSHLNISQSNAILYKPLTLFIFNSNESDSSRKCSMKMKDFYLTCFKRQVSEHVSWQ